MHQVKIGDNAEMKQVATASIVDSFAAITGDRNPIHLDATYAATTRFGRRIAHGMLGASYISAVLGMLLPGPGSIYLGQTLTFRAPIFLDDVVTTRVEVTLVRPDKRIVTLSTTCRNQAGELLIEGDATLMVPGLSGDATHSR